MSGTARLARRVSLMRWKPGVERPQRGASFACFDPFVTVCGLAVAVAAYLALAGAPCWQVLYALEHAAVLLFLPQMCFRQ